MVAENNEKFVVSSGNWTRIFGLLEYRLGPIKLSSRNYFVFLINSLPIGWIPSFISWPHSFSQWCSVWVKSSLLRYWVVSESRFTAYYVFQLSSEVLDFETNKPKIYCLYYTDRYGMQCMASNQVHAWYHCIPSASRVYLMTLIIVPLCH